jgi:hypothetical protein
MNTSTLFLTEIKAAVFKNVCRMMFISAKMLKITWMIISKVIYDNFISPHPKETENSW